MADESQQSKSPVTSPQSPVPSENKKVGSLVERLRSYESDVARLKNIPLAPVVPDRPLVEVRAPEPDPLDIAGKPPPYLDANGNTAATIEAANTLVSDVQKEDPQRAVDALHKEAPIQQFRTIQTDVADAAKQKHTTVSEIYEKQAKTDAIRRPAVIEDPKRSFFLLGLSGILIAGGLIALGGFYLIKTRPGTTPTVVVDVKNIVTTEGVKKFQLSDSQSLMDMIVAAKKDAPGTSNEIVKLVVSDTGTDQIDAEQFLTALSPSAPSWLARSFDPSVYLAGLHNGTNGWQVVLMFKYTSFENAYGGMLKWEETIADEWQPLFNSRQVNAAASIGSSSPQTSAPVIPTRFKDVVIKNKDVRVLEDSLGRRLILYSFVDPNVVVISTDQATLEEAFARLTTSKFVR
ncbi:MAG: protein of unknown function with transrane region [Candidatus Paceibacter sp.]|jgi:hypothetical protein|nr:protein of unknown function with transrane region [Candidatus Paceibacter sp.]